MYDAEQLNKPEHSPYNTSHVYYIAERLHWSLDEVQSLMRFQMVITDS